MSTKRNTRKSFWARMDPRSRMYFVLALCCAMVLVTVIAAFLMVHDFSAGGDSDPAASDSTLVEDASYNKDENAIDTTQYSSTILEESSDAGQSYVDETLFLGDSNTARMRMYGYLSLDNSLASVGMSARSLATYACVKFSGYSSYVTMPEAVALMQPRRVIITFGTNDLSPSYSTSSFIENYKKGIDAVAEAYPSVDIIINSIPPLGQSHSNASLTQTQVDEYNKALVQMCEENGWKYLNSAEVLKDSSTGYAKSGYVVSSDGIHLTETAIQTLFDYIRTHSYITEDDRPTLKSIPTHTGDKDVSSSTASQVITSTPAPVTAAPAPTEEPEATATPTPTPTATPSPTPSPTPTSTPTYTYTEEVTQEPTCTEAGKKIYHCNEDSSKSYPESIPALGHNYVDGFCTRCGQADPNYVAPSTSPDTSSSETTSSSTSSSTENTGDASSASSDANQADAPQDDGAASAAEPSAEAADVQPAA